MVYLTVSYNNLIGAWTFNSNQCGIHEQWRVEAAKALREDSGRPGTRNRSGRPKSSGHLLMVDNMHGNTATTTDGTTHSLTTIRPVDKESQSTTIGLRLVGS